MVHIADTTYIVLDESGAMHLKDERFFVISGFITRELHKVISAHKIAGKVVKERKGIPLDKEIELKSSIINDSQQSVFLEELYNISDLIPIAIVVDKYNLESFCASENLAYNFFVKNLLKYLFCCKIPILETKHIILRVDNRNVSVKKLMDLSTFLQWEFELLDLKVEVQYLDSKDNRDVQMADYLANFIWKKYSKPTTEKISRKVTRYYKTYVSKFPLKKFGNNPTVKELVLANGGSTVLTEENLNSTLVENIEKN